MMSSGVMVIWSLIWFCKIQDGAESSVGAVSLSTQVFLHLISLCGWSFSKHIPSGNIPSVSIQEEGSGSSNLLRSGFRSPKISHLSHFTTQNHHRTSSDSRGGIALLWMSGVAWVYREGGIAGGCVKVFQRNRVNAMGWGGGRKGERERGGENERKRGGVYF